MYSRVGCVCVRAGSQSIEHFERVECQGVKGNDNHQISRRFFAIFNKAPLKNSFSIVSIEPAHRCVTTFLGVRFN